MLVIIIYHFINKKTLRGVKTSFPRLIDDKRQSQNWNSGVHFLVYTTLPPQDDTSGNPRLAIISSKSNF